MRHICLYRISSNISNTRVFIHSVTRYCLCYLCVWPQLVLDKPNFNPSCHQCGEYHCTCNIHVIVNFTIIISANTKGRANPWIRDARPSLVDNLCVFCLACTLFHFISLLLHYSSSLWLNVSIFVYFRRTRDTN